MNKPQPIGRPSQTTQTSGSAPRKLRAGRPIGLKGEDASPFSGNAAHAPKTAERPSKPVRWVRPDAAVSSVEGSGGDLLVSANAGFKR